MTNLVELIRSILLHAAGGEFDICIVVNRTGEHELRLPKKYSSIPIEYRHNLGMNIGAWDHGWRTHGGYRDYLFLQDECYVIRENWLAGYRSCLSTPTIGMVGESINRGWERSWADLREVLADSKMPGHLIDGKAVNRIDCYLHFLNAHNVALGADGKHLRSVVWFFPGEVLEKIDGFLIGRNYGECIAAEIAASKKVEALGLKVAQAKEEEFCYIRHLEYNQDRPGGPYTHNAKYVNVASVRHVLEAKESNFFWNLKQKLERYFSPKQRVN